MRNKYVYIPFFQKCIFWGEKQNIAVDVILLCMYRINRWTSFISIYIYIYIGYSLPLSPFCIFCINVNLKTMVNHVFGNLQYLTTLVEGVNNSKSTVLFPKFSLRQIAKCWKTGVAFFCTVNQSLVSLCKSDPTLFYSQKVRLC